MNCPDKCGEEYILLTTELKSFCWECTKCGWFERIYRKSYEATVKRNKEEASSGTDKG